LALHDTFYGIMRSDMSKTLIKHIFTDDIKWLFYQVETGQATRDDFQKAIKSVRQSLTP